VSIQGFFKIRGLAQDIVLAGGCQEFCVNRFFDRSHDAPLPEAKTLTGFALPSVLRQPSGAMAAVVYTNHLIPSLAGAKIKIPVL
jgi:hypothetical protein